MTWREKAADSQYQTAVAIRDQLQSGHVEEARQGLEELIDAMARSDRRALRSQLIRLMVHVIKWLSQPDRRSRSWASSIRQARAEIAEIQEETPSLTEEVIRAAWSRCFELAKDQADSEMDQASAATTLTWDEVFNTEYGIKG